MTYSDIAKFLRNETNQIILQGIISIILLLFSAIYAIALIAGVIDSYWLNIAAIVVIMICPQILRNCIAKL